MVIAAKLGVHRTTGRRVPYGAKVKTAWSRLPTTAGGNDPPTARPVKNA